MNLLPNTEKEILKKGLKLRATGVINLLLATSFLIGAVMLLPAYFLTRGHFDIITSANSVIKTEDAESIKQILDLPKEIDVKLKFFQTNAESRGAVDALSKVISYLPKKVKLNSVLLTRNQGEKEKRGIALVISGIAADREALVAFDEALKASKSFLNVDVPVSSLTKERNLPFSMNIFIEDQK